MVEVDLEGMRELRESLLQAVDRYPDMAQAALEQEGKDFKSDVLAETRSAVFRRTGNLARGYKLDKVEGYGSDMHINFRATAPHFHLIENGHRKVSPKTRRGKKLKNGGRDLGGFVPGFLILSSVRARYDVKMPKDIMEKFNSFLRENGL